MLTEVLSLILWMPSIMLILGSLPLGVLSSMIKCAVYVVMSSPLILIGTTTLCLGGTLRFYFTVPIVALWVLACVKVKNLPFCCI